MKLSTKDRRPVRKGQDRTGPDRHDGRRNLLSFHFATMPRNARLRRRKGVLKPVLPEMLEEEVVGMEIRVEAAAGGCPA